MAQNYIRQSSFSDGDTITASLFNNEYNQLLNAFNYSSTDSGATGHRHDGSTGEGGNIPKIGDIDFLNKIEVDGGNNRWGVYVEVSGVSTEQVRFQDGSIVPVTTNDIDLGTGSLQFKNLYIDGTASIDSLTLSSGSTVTVILDEDNLATNSDTALATQQSIKAYVDSQITANNELSEVLANGNTTGANNIVVAAGQSITTNSILETTAAAGVDIDGILLKDTSVGTDDASGTDIAGTNVTLRGGAGTGTGAGGSLIFQTAPAAGTTGSTPNAQVTALTINSAGDATFTGASYNMSWDKSDNALEFADNAKAVFGTGSDLQIYHDGSNSFIKDEGTGDLIIQGTDKVRIRSAAGENMALFNADGSVQLQYDNVTKFVTTSTGIDVTGTVTADSASLNNDAASFTIYSADLTRHQRFRRNSSNSLILDKYNGTTTTNTAKFDENGDISFYEDTGTTAKLFWDASAESLGIGTASPSSLQAGAENLVVGSGLGDEGMTIYSGTANRGNIYFADGTTGSEPYRGQINYFHDSDYLRFVTAAAERMRIDSSGYLLVGTTSASGASAPDNSATASDAGIRLSPTGFIGLGANQAPSGYFNRIGNDGAIAIFNKDGVPVGSISTISSDLCIGSSITRVRFDDNGAITPRNASDANSDATIDLGQSGGRFKDLYLSGKAQADTYQFAQNSAATGATEAVYRPTTGQIAFKTNSSERMRIDSSGRVGIGVSPAKTLDVRTSSGSDAVIRVGSSSSIGTNVNVGAIEFYSADADDAGVKASIANYVTGNEGPGGAVDGNLIFSTTDSDGGGNDSPTERLRIDSSGNVGIGTASPSQPLHVYHPTTNGVATFQSGDANVNISLMDSATTAANYVGIGAVGNNLTFISGNGSERMRIDSSGNVGIGTTSPNANLEISGASSPQLRVTDTTNTVTAKVMSDDTSGYVGTQTSHDFSILVGNSVKATVDTSGNVGIGTTSPSAKIGVNATAPDFTFLQSDVVKFRSGVSGTTNGGVTGSASGDYFARTTGGKMLFSVDDGVTAHAVIDSSGNLLVGKTSADYTTAGVMAEGDGTISAVKAGTTGVFNRLTSDGDILQFRKDGATVGSIGTSSSSLYIGKPSGSGLMFQGGNTIPVTGSSAADATYDLGASGVRFKDLYLSGGLYVGGTGAANYLDDYEEGTWTPEYAPGTGSFTTITYDGQTGHYVKVGALVTAWCYIRTASLDTTGASGTISITGFPFAANSGSSVGTGSCSAQDAWTTRMPTITWISGSSATLGYGDDASTSYNGISVPNMTTGTSKNRLYAVWSYQTTS